MEAYVIFKF